MTNEKTPDFGHKITYEWLYASDLTIDRRVQQQLDQRKADRIESDFQPSALGTCTVSRRDDGTNVMVNGQHRTTGAKQAGYPGPFHCEVHHGLTLKEEARLFLALNNQTTPSVLSKFLVRVTEGDSVALDIEAICASHGWRVHAGGADGNLTAVTAIERVYRNAAGSKPAAEYPDLTDEVMRAVTTAWGLDYRAVNGQILMGLAQVFGRFGDAVNTAKLVKEMQTTTPVSLVGSAKALQGGLGGSVASSIARILVGMHNRKLRTNLLPEWVWTR